MNTAKGSMPEDPPPMGKDVSRRATFILIPTNEMSDKVQLVWQQLRTRESYVDGRVVEIPAPQRERSGSSSDLVS